MHRKASVLSNVSERVKITMQSHYPTAFLAHQSEDKSRVQTVLEHLEGTAALAEQFALPFGGGEQARLAGHRQIQRGLSKAAAGQQLHGGSFHCRCAGSVLPAAAGSGFRHCRPPQRPAGRRFFHQPQRDADPMRTAQKSSRALRSLVPGGPAQPPKRQTSGTDRTRPSQ